MGSWLKPQTAESKTNQTWTLNLYAAPQTNPNPSTL